MPSKSLAQAKLMRAVAHGFKPDQFKGPTKKVAKEFVRADKSKTSRPARAKDRKDKLNKWALGSEASSKRVKHAHGDAKSNVGEYRT